MKKLLLFMTVLLSNIVVMSAQTQIGIIGSAVDGSVTDVKMFPADSENYISPGYQLKRGTLWFRENNSINWGAMAFPSGTAVKNSSDAIFIEVAGVYDISFNRISGAYSVIGEGTPPVDPVDPVDPTFASIGVIGTAIGGWAADVDMVTTDGITYTLANQVLVAGDAKFRQDDAWTINWGPSATAGVAALGVPGNIAIAAGGTYNITFNKETLAYSFELVGDPDPVDPVDPVDPTFASIGIIGTAVGGWDADIDLTTTDGITYTLANQTVIDGVAKFRQDNAWTINWGAAAFPAGTGVQNGVDIVVLAGTYDITFNKETGAYSFNEPSLGVGSFESSSFTVYPNPVTEGVLYFSVATDVTVYDLSGRLVAQASNASSINVSSLSTGVYVVKAANGQTTRVLVK